MKLLFNVTAILSKKRNTLKQKIRRTYSWIKEGFFFFKGKNVVIEETKKKLHYLTLLFLILPPHGENFTMDFQWFIAQSLAMAGLEIQGPIRPE